MIIALDISLAEFGIAVFDLAGQLVHCECVITKPIKKKLNPRQIDSDHLRVKEIVMRLNSLHAQFGFRGIVAEVPPGGTQGARSATALGLVYVELLIMLSDWANLLLLQAERPKSLCIINQVINYEATPANRSSSATKEGPVMVHYQH